tara:strand:+ start:1759 stop:1965 length:207 start_codon:yes stop_codon:yes gene_type:complete
MPKLIFFAFLFLPTYTYAYLGPGMGGGIIIASIGIIAAIFIGTLGVLWFPIKSFFKKRKKLKKQKNQK